MFLKSFFSGARRHLKILAVISGTSVLFVQGCAQLLALTEDLGGDRDRYVESLKKERGLLELLLLRNQVAKTYESFLANTETGTVGWGSEKSYRRVKPLGSEVNVIESDDKFVTFVVNHHNSQDALTQPTHLAVRMILVIKPEASGQGKVTVYRNQNWWDDEENRRDKSTLRQPIANLSAEDFAKAHAQSVIDPPRKEIQKWHAKVLPVQPSTWERPESREFWAEWKELFPPEGEPKALLDTLSVEGDAKIHSKNYLLRFSETPASSSEHPIVFNVNRNQVLGLRISTWCPDSPDNYRKDLYVRFDKNTRNSS